MCKIDINEITNKISAFIRVGGSTISIVNPFLGVGIVALGEFLPFIANEVNTRKQRVFFNSIESNIIENKVLIEYEKQPEVYDQILSTVRKSLLAESNFTIYLMGKITANSLNENRKYTQNELQVIDALYKMNDYDFINFVHLCNQFDELGKKSSGVILLDEADIHDEIDSTKDNIVFTLKKLYNFNLFSYSSLAIFEEIDPTSIHSSNFFLMNSLTEYLLGLLENEMVKSREL